MTDTLGVMETWADGVTTVRGESGVVTAIAIRDIVSGKPVPPRPSLHLRLSALEVERRALASWPAVERLPLVPGSGAGWLLRAAGGFSARANSVLAVGDPGLGQDAALQRVRQFYAERSLPAWAQVVPETPEHSALEEAGWLPARPGEADTRFLVGSVARAVREVRRALTAPARPVRLTSTLDAAWLANDSRASLHAEAARAVLEGPAEVAFAAALTGDRVVAKGRVAGAADLADGWVGITDVWVSSDHRRQGLGSSVVHALLSWGAERGATTAYLQVRGDNPGALAIYERLGFREHHRYRYLAAP
jgi:ribosomal protein S18 acetylase RimI-like enzyme